MKKILVFGTFDILHPGHLDFFKQAREHGDHLTAVVALDDTVEEQKGERPANTEKERLQTVRECELADEAVLGNKGDRFTIIKDIKPDVICLGYDQWAKEDELKERLKKMGIACEIHRLKPYMPNKYKSSLLKMSFRP